MVTNDERRRAAAALRAMAKRLGPNMDAHEFANYGADAIDPDNGIARWDEMTYRLADLIDHDTKMAQDSPRRLEDVEASDRIISQADRETLLAISEEMLSVSIGINSADNIRPLEAAYILQGYARRIREACGEEP